MDVACVPTEALHQHPTSSNAEHPDVDDQNVSAAYLVDSRSPGATGLRPAPVGRRVAARALDYGVGGLLVLLFYAVLFSRMAGPVELLGLLVLWSAAFVVTELVASATPGQRLLGLRNVELTTGRPSGPRTLAKYVLYGLFSSVSCGLLVLIAAVTLEGPLRRSWFDKMTGLVLVDERQGMPVPQPRPAQAVLPPPVAPTPVAPPVRQQESVDGREVPDLTVVRRPTAGGALQLDTGERISLERDAVLGRDPVAPATFADAQVHAVIDEARSVSKTHMVVGRDVDGVWVIDLSSTNGVVVTGRDGVEQTLAPGERTPVPPGSRLTFGDRTARVVT